MKKKLYFHLLFLFGAFIFSGCTKLQLKPAQSTPDIEKTVYWMVDDASMRLATQILREVEEKFEALRQNSAATAERPSAIPFPSATPDVTTIPDSLRNKSNVPTAETPIVCINELKFIEDITIKDKTVVTAGKPFTKTWKIQNSGSCEWNDKYQIVFSDGDQMDAMSVIPFPKEQTVKPDDTIEISVYMTAPEKAGAYAGYWMLESASGQRFGAGKNRDKPIWVKVEVR